MSTHNPKAKLYIIIGLALLVLVGLGTLGAYRQSAKTATSTSSNFGGVTISHDQRSSPDSQLASGSGIFITNSSLLDSYLPGGEQLDVEAQIKRLIYNQSGVIVTMGAIRGNISKQTSGSFEFNLLTSEDQTVHTISVTHDSNGNPVAQLK